MTSNEDETWLIYCQHTNKYGFTETYYEDLQGRRQGLAIGTYHNKQVSYEYTYKDSEKHGTCITYNDNGTIRLIENYKEGILDGIYEKFYSNGSKKARMFYIAGTITGQVEHWDPLGRPSAWAYPSEPLQEVTSL
jgi:antitoxin component YwqK of YwqJK toxin-antitoxin module